MLGVAVHQNAHCKIRVITQPILSVVTVNIK